MRTMIRRVLVTTGLLSGLSMSLLVAQTSDTDLSAEKMSGKKMSHQQMMDKMDKMSADEKASMFDSMTEKEKMSAMKMGGHDMGKMPHQESMDMMGKMSTQDKADMFDKMPMEKKMFMMKDSSKMHKDKKMDNPDKTGTSK